MPIESSVVAQTTLNGDGSIAVREEHTFHNSVKRHFRYDAMGGANHSLSLSIHATLVLQKEKERELGDFTAWLVKNRDPASFDRQHNTADALIKPLLRVFMNIKDPVRALKAARKSVV